MHEPHVTDAQRQAVYERARERCEYCRSLDSVSTERFAVDHIIPKVKGGKTQVDNLALCCRGCNEYKSDKTKAVDPQGGKTVALFHPRRQRWVSHFAWSEDLVHVIGLTPTGRATVEALRLNREGLVSLRRAMMAVAWHPPKEDR